MRENAVFVSGNLPITLFSSAPLVPVHANLFAPLSRHDAILQHFQRVQRLLFVSNEAVHHPIAFTLDPYTDLTCSSDPGVLMVATFQCGPSIVAVRYYSDSSVPRTQQELLDLAFTTNLSNIISADYAIFSYSSGHTYPAALPSGHRYPEWWRRSAAADVCRRWTSPVVFTRTGGSGQYLSIPVERGSEVCASPFVSSGY